MRFVVQLEVLLNETWVPVVRYDMAHGTPHVHRYASRASATKSVVALPPGQALTFAETDVAENWTRYRDDFLRSNS